MISKYLLRLINTHHLSIILLILKPYLLGICLLSIPVIYGTELANTQDNIHSIQIITKNKPLKLNIEQQLSTYIGQPLSDKTTNKIYSQFISILKQKKILQPNIKESIVKTPKKGYTIYYYINNPYQYGFAIKGNKAIRDYTLLSKKIYNKIFNNKQFIQKIIFYIQDTYIKKGYTKTKISYSIRTDEKYFIKTIFLSITEGVLLTIKNIDLIGQFSQPKKYYINLIKEYGGKLIQKGLFYNEDFHRGLKNLINILRNQGYLKAIIYHKIKEKNNQITIEITLNEGPATKIGKIILAGNHYFSNEYLQKIINIQPQSVLDTTKIEKAVQSIISTYKNAGFIEIQLNDNRSIVQYNKNQLIADLYFKIKENSKITIADIIINGNTITKKEFILRVLPIKRGDVLTSKKINLALKNLRKTWLFSSIQIATTDVSQEKVGKKNVVIKVEERKPWSIRFAMGVNTQRILTARGLVQLSNKNIFGTGRKIFSDFKIQSNIARYWQLQSSTPKHIEHHISLFYIEPFLFRSKFNGQLSVSNADIISLYNEKKRAINVVRTTKVNFLLNRQLNDYVQLNWSVIKWEGRNEFEKSHACSPINNSILIFHNCQNNTLNIVSTGLSMNIDKRDSIVSTSDGFLSQLSGEYAGPFNIFNVSENVNFVKLELKHFDFHPIFRKWVWVNSIQSGFITNMNYLGQGGIPVSRSFILGGVSSLRGFDGLLDGDRVPDKEELPIASANTLIFTPYSLFVLLKTELRIPISQQLNGIIFYDGGGVIIAGKIFSEPYRHSAGFGIRYQTPLGPVSGYLAFKISPKPHEALYVPHLSFGIF